MPCIATAAVAVRRMLLMSSPYVVMKTSTVIGHSSRNMRHSCGVFSVFERRISLTSYSRSWERLNAKPRGLCPLDRTVHIDSSAWVTRIVSATITRVYGSQSPRLAGFSRNAA